MATGENFMRLQWQFQEARKPKIKVDKKTEQKINAEIKELQKQDSALWANDNLLDNELETLSAELNKKIRFLIDSMY